MAQGRKRDQTTRKIRRPTEVLQALGRKKDETRQVGQEKETQKSKEVVENLFTKKKMSKELQETKKIYEQKAQPSRTMRRRLGAGGPVIVDHGDSDCLRHLSPAKVFF